MSLLSAIKGNGPSGFGYGSTAEEVTQGIDLKGKTFILTGCNSGLGLETLRVLTLRGGQVIAAARTLEKAEKACHSFPNCTPVSCELSEPESVRQCASQVEKLDRPLDGIIANAGIMALPGLHQKRGFELQFLTNHIGHFILVTSLLDSLAEEARVVVVSSSAHKRAPKEGIQFDNLSGEKGYSSITAYGQSKLANLLFARQLAKRLPFPGQTANAVHPGVIATNLNRYMSPVFGLLLAIANPILLKSVPQGAATQCFVAVHPDASKISGQYFEDCNPAVPSRLGQDDGLAERLWVASKAIDAALL